MTDKDKPNQKNPRKLTDEETTEVVGGVISHGGTGTGGIGGGVMDQPPSCKETTDTGMMGCPG